MTWRYENGPRLGGPLPQQLPPHSNDPVELVVIRLRALGKKVTTSGSQRVAQCPAHKDHTPSLSVGRGHDDRALLFCHAGCSGDEIVRALRLEYRDLFARKPWTGPRGWRR